jgi:hypothetical protein
MRTISPALISVNEAHPFAMWANVFSGIDLLDVRPRVVRFLLCGRFAIPAILVEIQRSNYIELVTQRA